MTLKVARLAHLVLRVRDLERSEKFYREVLGLKVTAQIPGRMTFLAASDASSHELGLMAVSPSAPGPDPRRAGLYHFAWQVDSLEELQAFEKRLREKGVEVVGVGDHGISLGYYFLDPDGNEIEVFYELPQKQWPKSGNIFQGKFPLPAGG